MDPFDSPSAIEDRRYFLELAMGMWAHTRELAGKPTLSEVNATLDQGPVLGLVHRIRIIGSLRDGGEIAQARA